MLGNSTVRRAGALPREPTPAPPGSEEKIRVMTERAARREQLFHPLDGLNYRGRPPAPREEATDWPCGLPEEQPDPALSEILDDFDEDDEDLAEMDGPDYAAWTEAPPPADLPAAPVADVVHQSLPVVSPG